jgi:hypothetical protein
MIAALSNLLHVSEGEGMGPSCNSTQAGAGSGRQQEMQDILDKLHAAVVSQRNVLTFSTLVGVV